MRLGLGLGLCARRSGGRSAADYAANGETPDVITDHVNEFYLDSSGNDDFAGVTTFSRSGSARYFDSAGVLQTTANARQASHIYSSSWENSGLFLETSARTNLTLQSEDFTTSWTAYETTVTSNSIAAPDGTTTADLITCSGANDVHRVQATATITITSDDNYAISTFIRAGTHDFVTIGGYGSSEEFIAATFDLGGGGTSADETDVGTTSGTIVSTHIIDLGGGWLRLVIVGSITHGSLIPFICFAEAATGGSYTPFGQPVWDAAGTETIYAWGHQTEAGSTPSSYIPTSGSSASRSAEALSIAAANTNPGTTNLTIYGREVVTRAVSEAMTLFDWRADANNRITVGINTSNQVFVQHVLSGVTTTVIGGTMSGGVNEALRWAVRCTASAVNIIVDGTAATEGSTSGIPNLASADIDFQGMGHWSEARVWESADIGDLALEALTDPLA